MSIFRSTTGLVLVTLLLSLVGVIGSSGTAYATLGTDDYPYASYDGPGSNPAGSWWTDPNGNGYSPYGFVYRNCTDFVAWRLNNDNKFTGLPHGIGTGATSWGTWAAKAGYTVDSTPAAGAVAWWAAGTLDNGYTIGGSGHVAYVDSVNSDGVTANIEEYNYGSTGLWHHRPIAIGPKQQVQYIHLADLSSTPASPPPPPPPWPGVGNATFVGNQLTSGQQLHANQYIMSPNGQFVLIMQPDGNLVEYTGNVLGFIWQTATQGNSGAYLGVQGDGNVVVYSAAGVALWNTGPLGITKFVVQDDANVVGYNASGGAAWSSGHTSASPGSGYSGTDSLTTGMTLGSGQYLRSADGRYFALMQTDGNLVVYQPGYIVKWNSGTQGYPGAWLKVQGDGNVVVYSAAGTALWNTTPENIGRLTIQTDGSLVGYSTVNTAQWVMGSYVGNPWPGIGTATFLGNQLTTGQQMHSNQYIMAPSGRFVLIMQPDGNLVEYTSLGSIWSTKTTGNSGAYLGVQGDGNVVIYSASNVALWSTGPQGITKLAVQDDENIVGYNSAGTPVWASGIRTDPLGLTYVSDTLTTGQSLTSGHYLRSADGRYFALMQSDGNLVVYAPGYRGLTSTQTGGNAGAYLTVQADGNMVIYASNGTTALWYTGPKGITKLVMQSDGNLVAFNAAGTPVWYTGTTGAT